MTIIEVRYHRFELIQQPERIYGGLNASTGDWSGMVADVWKKVRGALREQVVGILSRSANDEASPCSVPTNHVPNRLAQGMDFAMSEISCTYSRSSATECSSAYNVDVITFMARLPREKSAMYTMAWTFDIWACIRSHFAFWCDVCSLLILYMIGLQYILGAQLFRIPGMVLHYAIDRRGERPRRTCGIFESRFLN